jgi:hypothetical protein
VASSAEAGTGVDRAEVRKDSSAQQQKKEKTGRTTTTADRAEVKKYSSAQQQKKQKT